MPVKQTVSIRFPNAKRGSILMEDASLTLNDKGEVVRMSKSAPLSSSRTIVAVALLALADSNNKDLYLPAIHALPSPRTNHFSGNKGPTKTKIAAERKAAKEAKQKDAKGKKAATAACKADGLAKKQEKRISSTKAKASTAAAKAEALRSKLVDMMKSAAIPEAAHHHKKSKGMLGTAPTNSPLAHTLPLSTQRKCVCGFFLASGYNWVTVMHEIPVSSAQMMTSFQTLELSSTIPLVPLKRGMFHMRRFQRVRSI
jgi:hypothetical protein